MTTASPAAAFRLGIYDKTLPVHLTWPQRLADAAGAACRFVEISIDESDERVPRLEWGHTARMGLHRARAGATGSIETMCLYGTGSLSTEAVHEKANPTFLCRLIDLLTVKGEGPLVRIFEILYEKKGVPPEDRGAQGGFRELPRTLPQAEMRRGGEGLRVAAGRVQARDERGVPQEDLAPPQEPAAEGLGRGFQPHREVGVPSGLRSSIQLALSLRERRVEERPVAEG
jgi:hypothetical protein